MRQSTLDMGSSVPLMHHDPCDLGLICLVKKRKIRFRIYRDLDFLKETQPYDLLMTVLYRRVSHNFCHHTYLSLKPL